MGNYGVYEYFCPGSVCSSPILSTMLIKLPITFTSLDKLSISLSLESMSCYMPNSHCVFLSMTEVPAPLSSKALIGSPESLIGRMKDISSLLKGSLVTITFPFEHVRLSLHSLMECPFSLHFAHFFSGQ